MKLSDSVKVLAGVGPKTAAALAKMGVTDIASLLTHAPARYIDISRPAPLYQLIAGDTGVCRLKVLSVPRFIKRTHAMSVLTFEAGDSSMKAGVFFFNMPYMLSRFKPGEEYIFVGPVSDFKGKPQFSNPMVFEGERSGVLAFYHVCKGVSQQLMRKLTAEALDKTPIAERYSQDFLYTYGLMSDARELEALHRPCSLAEAQEAKTSADVKSLLVRVALLDALSAGDGAPVINSAPDSVDTFCARLPFAPTGAQRRAMSEIAADMARSKPMNRLLQGDVGTGKTLPAMFALWLAASSGRCCAMMAPTQILCEQHYSNAKELLADCGVALLSGSSTAAQRRKMREDVDSGRVRVIIGTHALIYNQEWDFALIITDEQHRFGVSQRARLAHGGSAHTLLLSATPIPRTLALVLYGKASVSVLDEAPAGRQPIKTHIVPPGKRSAMYEYIRKQTAAGAQAYVVCPLIDDNPDFAARSIETLCKELAPVFGEDMLILHGRMKAEEKTEVMRAFKSGEKHVLLATTVIEVGVDVPEATVMVIENAERFGLAQLHQLRGRVGRGGRSSECYLVSERRDTERLNILKNSADGFFLAEKDMELRGSGDMLGHAQHGAGIGGIPDPEMAVKVRDMLADARFPDDVRRISEEAAELAARSEIVLN